MVKRETMLLTLMLCIFCAAKSQTYFEGRVVMKMVYVNPPEAMKPYLKDTEATQYYAKGKNRMDMSTNISGIESKTVIITDYIKKEQLVLTDIPSLKMKQAKLNKLEAVAGAPGPSDIQYFEEYKTFLGRNTQKSRMVAHYGGTESVSIAYVLKDVLVSSTPTKDGADTFFPFPLYTESEVQGVGQIVTEITVFEEGKLDEKLFDLTIPPGYTLEAKTPPPPPVANTSGESTEGEMAALFSSMGKSEVKPSYKSKTVEELKKMITEALQKEDYLYAEELQKELATRGAQSVTPAGSGYEKYSTAELKTMIDEAVKVEDFEKADALKKELDKRPK